MVKKRSTNKGKKGKVPVNNLTSGTSPHIKAVRDELAKLRRKIREL